MEDSKSSHRKRSDSQRIEYSSDSQKNCRVWLASSGNYGNPFCQSEIREAYIESTPRIPWFASIPRSIPYFASIPYIKDRIAGIPGSYVARVMIPKLIATKVVSLKKFYALFSEEIDTLTDLISPTTTLEHLLGPSEQGSLASYLNMTDTLYVLLKHMQTLNDLKISRKKLFFFSCTLQNVHIARWAFHDWQKHMEKTGIEYGVEKLLANELYHDLHAPQAWGRQGCA